MWYGVCGGVYVYVVVVGCECVWWGVSVCVCVAVCVVVVGCVCVYVWWWWGVVLPALGFWTSSLQSCERIHFCCVKPPRLWDFVMAVLGD